MKNKFQLLLLIILIGMLGLLAYIYFYAESKKVPDVLFITPKQPLNTAIDYKKIEDKNGEDFLLTYETSDSKNIKALEKNHDVLWKGTNYLYPYVMSSPMVAGSFFSKDAQRENKKLAVLNKKSAFDMFGNLEITNAEFKIGDEIFTVIGIIDDRDKKNMNVYVPIYYSEKPIDSFAVLIDRDEKTPEASVENKLKQFNINSKLYYFYNFNLFQDSMGLRLALSLQLFLLVNLIYFLVKCFKSFRKQLIFLQEKSKQLDFGDLFMNNKLTVGLMVFFALSFIGFVFGALITTIGVTENILGLLDVKSVMLTDYSTGFINVIYMFNKLSVYSLGAFTACIGIMVLFTMTTLITGEKAKHS